MDAQYTYTAQEIAPAKKVGLTRAIRTQNIDKDEQKDRTKNR